MKNKSLLNLTLLYAIGNISSKAMSFFLVFFVTFYFSTEEVGEFDLILVTISLLVPFVTLQLSDSVLRWLLNDHSDENIRKVFSNVSVALFFSLMFFLILLVIYNYFFEAKFLFYLFVLISFQSYNVFLLQFTRGLGKNKTYVLNGLLNTFLYIIFPLAKDNFTIPI